jgi:hypothetical protein
MEGGARGVRWHLDYFIKALSSLFSASSTF